MYAHHIQVLKTLRDSGLITKHKMKSLRGQVMSIENFDEREKYIKKIIHECGEVI